MVEQKILNRPRKNSEMEPSTIVLEDVPETFDVFIGANPDPILDSTAAGVYIGGLLTPIEPDTMAEWRHQKKGPNWLKIGRLARYFKSDLDAYLKRQRRTHD